MIRLDGVVKRFGEHTVLDGLTFTVPERRTLALLGRSGSGKSVVLKHIVGLLRPDAGTITVGGQDVATLDDAGLAALRRDIGYVFQFAALFDSMTCEANLRLALAHRGLAEDEIAARIAGALATVGLPDVGPRSPAELSGGMRKRVGIARAMVIQPRYILWDEPTTGLDPVTTATMDRLMQRVRTELGVTAVVVTHDLHSAFAVADEIAFLHEGRIRAHGSVTAFQASEDPIVRQFLEGRPE